MTSYWLKSVLMVSEPNNQQKLKRFPSRLSTHNRSKR